MMTMKRLPQRDEVSAECTWDKMDVYPSDEAWEVAAERHQRALALIARVDEALAYFEPELLTLDRRGGSLPACSMSQGGPRSSPAPKGSVRQKG
jgi:hypothetical protein